MGLCTWGEGQGPEVPALPPSPPPNPFKGPEKAGPLAPTSPAKLKGLGEGVRAVGP